MKKKIWRSIPFIFRSFLLKLGWISRGNFPVPGARSISGWHINGVIDDLEKGSLYPKRTGYDSDGIYECFWTEHYAAKAPDYDVVLDIGSGPGMQILALKEINQEFDKKFILGSNFLAFEPSIKYSDLFRINLGEYPIRKFVVSERSDEYSLYNIYSRQIIGKSCFLKIDIEGYEFELLHELLSDNIFQNIEVLCEYHINKIINRGYDPVYLLDYIEKKTNIMYNLHHDSVRMRGVVDDQWRTERPNLQELDTISINFKL